MYLPSPAPSTNERTNEPGASLFSWGRLRIPDGCGILGESGFINGKLGGIFVFIFHPFLFLNEIFGGAFVSKRGG